MDSMYYIGLDVYKKTISYCVKDASGQVHQEGKVGATRCELDRGSGGRALLGLPTPWFFACEGDACEAGQGRRGGGAVARALGHCLRTVGLTMGGLELWSVQAATEGGDGDGVGCFGLRADFGAAEDHGGRGARTAEVGRLR
jgi:hypothetical protein